MMYKKQKSKAIIQKKSRNNGKAYLTDNRNETVQRKNNKTGLPDQLKSGIENLSGHSMDDVKVHYNSSRPAQLNAHAFAQGNQIHLASGQERYLPHEAWHVVQQKQGRVKPTLQLKGKVDVNDDAGLEKEADVMGGKAISTTNSEFTIQRKEYTISRNLKLNLGMKEWKGKVGEVDEVSGVKKTDQMAKTRARGEAKASLKEVYPDAGKEYDEALAALDIKYALKGDEKLEDKAYSSRVAIYKNAPVGERTEGTQAARANMVTKSNNYIGAHLVKKEWGGADNMWNVVAWLKTAEKKWATGFERPVDLRGIKGEDPGNISILVKKEDEYIKSGDHLKHLKKPLAFVTAMESVVFARGTANKAIESVPINSVGKNFESTTSLNSAETGYNSVITGAEKFFETEVKKADKIKKDRGDYGGRKPLPKDMKDAQLTVDNMNLKERQEDWLDEKNTYDAGGKGAFKYTNTLFPEK